MALDEANAKLRQHGVAEEHARGQRVELAHVVEDDDARRAQPHEFKTAYVFGKLGLDASGVLWRLCAGTFCVYLSFFGFITNYQLFLQTAFGFSGGAPSHQA